MWKWIVGGLLVLVLVVGGWGYTRLKRFTAGGDAATVTVAAPRDQVFTALADPDSMQAWMAEGSSVSSSHHGVVAVGDTLHVATGKLGSRSHQEFGWVVTEVTAGELLVRRMLSDSTGMVLTVRRDSLVAVGDSTLVVSTIASPMMETIKSERGDTGGKVGGAILNFSSKLIIASFRELTRLDLRRMKKHLEAKRP